LSHNFHASKDDVRAHHIEIIISDILVSSENSRTCRHFGENLSFDASSLWSAESEETWVLFNLWWESPATMSNNQIVSIMASAQMQDTQVMYIGEMERKKG
jgi:hypothetical protein